MQYRCMWPVQPSEHARRYTANRCMLSFGLYYASQENDLYKFLMLGHACGLADCVALTFEPWLLPPVCGRLMPLREATASQQAFIGIRMVHFHCHLQLAMSMKVTARLKVLFTGNLHTPAASIPELWHKCLYVRNERCYAEE
jgi:hypothetical protein